MPTHPLVASNLTDGVLSPSNFGANGSDNKDDTEAFQKCIDVAKNRKTSKIVIAPGRYIISKTIKIIVSIIFKRNIFIPNLYTFEPSETESSNLTNHNIMMLGRLVDKKKGLIYAIKAMSLIVKEIPDAKLNLVSSDTISQDFKNLANKLNLTNNIIYTPYTSKISEHFLNSSIFFFTSLTEAFPMALNEAKAYGLPCVTFDVSYSVPYQSGVIKVEMFDYEALAREAIKLLKDYDYRLKMGREAKLSLNRFNNNATADLWGRLFHALITSEDEFQKLREEIEKKYYNEKEAEEHMEKQLNNLLYFFK